VRRERALAGFAVGLLGMGTRIAIAKSVAFQASWSTTVRATSIVLATAVAVGVGLLSGRYPALRAAALDPIDPPRDE